VTHSGFDGYRFGFVDADGDGINDLNGCHYDMGFMEGSSGMGMGMGDVVWPDGGMMGR
jgi:hypothetical protein